MDAQISDRWGPFIRSQVQSGRHPSADSVIDEALRLLVERERVESDRAEPSVPGPMPVWERVLENMRHVPDEVFDRIPADSSEQLDHYVYGTPKRPPAR